MQTPIVPPSPPPSSAASQTGSGQAGSGQSGASSPSGTATAPSLPPSLAQALSTGGALTAQVSGRPQPGTLTLTIAGQSVQVQTPLPLPVGTTLTASLQSPGPPATLFLQPQSQGGAQAGQAGAVPTGGGQAAGQAIPSSPSVVTSLTQGSVLSATVTAAPSTAQTAAAAGTAPQVSSGSATAGQSNTAATAAGGATATGTSQTTALPPGTAMQVRLIGLAPPGQPLTMPPVTAGATGIFSGVVTGQTANGGVSVQTTIGTLNVSVPSAPPTGTQLLLQMVGDPRAPLPGTGTAEGSGARFEALRDAVALLRSGDPAAAQRMTQSLIPQANSQFGLAAVFLANAIRQGRFEKWGGTEAVRALTQSGGGSGLLSRLDGEMARAQGRVTDSAGQDWRVLTLPFMNQGQIEPIRLYMRDRPPSEDSAEDDANARKRFIIETDFSRLGPMQFDGLTQDKRVDVVVRSQRELEEKPKREIEALFVDTVTAMGLTGRVDFRVVAAFDPLPPEPSPTPEGGLTV